METLLIVMLAFGIIYIMLKSMHTNFESFHFKMETVVKCLSESFLDVFSHLKMEIIHFKKMAIFSFCTFAVLYK